MIYCVAMDNNKQKSIESAQKTHELLVIANCFVWCFLIVLIAFILSGGCEFIASLNNK